MTPRNWLRLAEILVSVLLAITILVAWRADRRDRAQLASQLAAAQKTIADASASQHDRDTLLKQSLAQLAAQKRAVVTQAQILKALPSAIPLPVAISLQSTPTKTVNAHPLPIQARAPVPRAPLTKLEAKASRSAQTLPADQNQSSPAPIYAAQTADKPPDAVLPAADLKPLYDFAIDCKACQAKLAAAQSDLNDEKTKTAVLTKERDAAVTAAKGGSVIHRILRAAKWLLIGAAAGAIAAKAAP
ncbi:MAG: hypothetical protein WCE61_20515 [Candidatus Acidiferrum sp.]